MFKSGFLSLTKFLLDGFLSVFGFITIEQRRQAIGYGVKGIVELRFKLCTLASRQLQGDRLVFNFEVLHIQPVAGTRVIDGAVFHKRHNCVVFARTGITMYKNVVAG